jgi:dihydroceramide fatty acyl 2-hydroxylase
MDEPPSAGPGSTIGPMAADPVPSSSRAEHLKASPPLLPWPLLDKLTRVHWSVPALLYLPVVAVLLWKATDRVSTLAIVLEVLAGYAVWTVSEYWLHRVVFHWEPPGELGQKLHFLLHGVHHEHPNDPKRLVMPPGASIPLALVFGLAFYAVLGADHWLAVFGGFLVGYVAYDTLHYAVHHHTPKSRAGKRLRELHMRHHFQDDRRGFGVSAPWWDHVFGTAPRKPGNRP